MKKALLALLVAGTAGLPRAAQACLYTQAPEAVGPASQAFFTQKMAEAATTVDIAVAGETRAAFGSDLSWRTPATTFYVIDRIKGFSPDRFTLFVGASGPEHRDIEAQHWVDKNGRVTPYPYPVEQEPVVGGIRSMTSCHPGFLSIREGEAYLVFRDAQGRLLGQFALYGDLTTAAFPLVRAGLGTREGWLAWAGPLQFDAPSRQQSLPPDRATVRFPRPLSAKEAQRWLRGTELRPFAVSVASGPVTDETRVPIGFAETALIERAVADARVNEALKALAILAARMRADITAEALENDALIRRHVWLVAEAASRARNSQAQPLIAAMEVTGSAVALTRLRNHPRGAEVIGGPLPSGALSVEQPGERAEQAQADAYWNETTASLLARLAAVADAQPMPAAVMKPPQPEPDPFALSDCIRFGREEAAELARLPERGRLGELTVFGMEAETVCSADSGLLSCDLAPNTSVRISWAGYEGGFRISPKGARLTFDGNGLQCNGD